MESWGGHMRLHTPPICHHVVPGICPMRVTWISSATNSCSPVHLWYEHPALPTVPPPTNEVDHVVVEDHGVIGPCPRHPTHLAPRLLLWAEFKEGVQDLVLVEPLPVVETAGHKNPLSPLHSRMLASTSSRQPCTHAPSVRLCAVTGEKKERLGDDDSFLSSVNAIVSAHHSTETSSSRAAVSLQPPMAYSFPPHSVSENRHLSRTIVPEISCNQPQCEQTTSSSGVRSISIHVL